jgi:long-chain acyl-CoA synthetase
MEVPNLGSLLHAVAVRNPSKAAAILDPTVVSYEQLDRRTTQLASWFLQQGCQPGDRIAIHWSNAIEVVELFFACFKAGLIAAPVNVRMKAPEIAYVLEHSKAVMCFSQPQLSSLAEEAGRDCASLRAMHSDLPELDSEADLALPTVVADQPALILYTSGTTARPKGVTHTHRTLLSSARLMVGVAPESMQVILVLTQMMHASGINCDLLPAILMGATCVLVPAFDAPVVLDLIERYQCSYTMGLPSQVQFLLEEQTRQPRNVNSLRTFIAGGDSVPVATQQRFQALFGIPLREGYGMTESLPSVFNPADAIRPGSLGRAVDGVEVRVVDQAGDDAPEGQTGEIVVRSPANCIGYWEDPQATHDALREGWLHTGDLGRRDAEGYHWFEGRKKEIIIRGGSNISPQEVEAAIYSHSAVLEAAVIGMPDPVFGEKVIAFVALREGLAAGEGELREYALQRLADYKVPERVLFLPELPKGITGKLQRRLLKQMAL